MNENAKNVIFKVLNAAIYALFGGKFSKFSKCTGAKYLTNMMSGDTYHALTQDRQQIKLTMQLNF